MDQDKRKEIINSSETQEDLGVREDGVQVTGSSQTPCPLQGYPPEEI